MTDYKILKAVRNGNEYTFDDGSNAYYVDALIVGGGGAGSSSAVGASGGGGGEILKTIVPVIGGSICMNIGQGGVGGSNYSVGCQGCPTTITKGDDIIAKANGGGTVPAIGRCGTRGGISGNMLCGGSPSINSSGYIETSGGGGGGACGIGGNAISSQYGGGGGQGYCGMGGGGGGSNHSTYYAGAYNCAVDGGGPGLSSGAQTTEALSATCYGGGGGGSSNCAIAGGSGYQGVVFICYKSDGSCGFTSATGGDCCYTCDGYCVHRFTSDGTFCIVS